MDTTLKQRLTGVALVATSLLALGACGSSAGSDSSGDASTTTAAKADDTAFVAKVNPACATHETEVKAANEAIEKASVSEIDALTLEQQTENVTQLTALSTTVNEAGGTSADAKAFATAMAELPGLTTTLNEASASLYGPEELSSAEAAELTKKLEAPTDALEDQLTKADKLAGTLGLTDCVAMFAAINPS